MNSYKVSAFHALLQEDSADARRRLKAFHVIAVLKLDRRNRIIRRDMQTDLSSLLG